MANQYPKWILTLVIFETYTPLGNDTSLTFHGAEYVFVGVANVSGSFSLDADSVFFVAICGGGSECTNTNSVVLNETLPCTSFVSAAAVSRT